MQRHDQRAEFWFVAEGLASVYTLDSSTDHELVGHFQEHQAIWIARNEWHIDRKSTRLNSSHVSESRMPSSA